MFRLVPVGDDSQQSGSQPPQPSQPSQPSQPPQPSPSPPPPATTYTPWDDNALNWKGVNGVD